MSWMMAAAVSIMMTPMMAIQVAVLGWVWSQVMKSFTWFALAFQYATFVATTRPALVTFEAVASDGDGYHVMCFVECHAFVTGH